MTINENEDLGDRETPKVIPRLPSQSTNTPPTPISSQPHDEVYVQTTDSSAAPESYDSTASTFGPMMQYWREALSDCECVPFPPISPSAEQPSADTTTECQLPLIREPAVKASTLIHAAWALVVGRQTNSKDVIFDANTATGGVSKGSAHEVNTVPVRIKLDGMQRVQEYLSTVQQQARDRAPFEKAGLERIGKSCAAVCLVQTQLVIQWKEDGDAWNELKKLSASHKHQCKEGYVLTLHIRCDPNQTMVTAQSDSRVIMPQMTSRLLRQLGFVIGQLQDAGAHERVSDIKLALPEDIQQIWAWNSTVPASIDRCVHDIIKERAEAQPNAPAICAWDGELTYGELDRISTNLAVKLIRSGVEENTMVPLCFEKSLWTTVAMLGVMKAGAAFVLMDSSLPRPRLQSIVQQAKANIVVSLHTMRSLSSSLAQKVVILGSHGSRALYDQPILHSCLPTGKPSSAMYIAFTSGSTGTPKGAIITHRNLASALHHQKESLTTTADSRVYDFSSYSFDVTICNAFATLSAGGCLCVPSEQDRRDRLAESIESLGANVIDVTPSVARLLALEQVAGLRTIIFGGEALYLRDVVPWWNRVQIVNLYGPCECTPNSTINCNPKSPEEASNMGKGVGLVTWVVETDNHDSLSPLGGVGELLLEGPLVGQGYLDDPEKTAAAFIEDPTWLLRGAPGHPGRRGRLYKTGDLVRYNEDGSLSFSGRKDAQVKIRGQRVELGEIEYALRSHVRVNDAVAVLQEVDGRETITSFVTIHEDGATLETRSVGGGESQHIGEWEKQFDEDYISFDSMQPNQLGRDFMGWTSMYDGSDIDKVEMDEWLNDTIETMLNGSQPGHVLEIGTGSGMILFNLPRGLQSYVGLEPSARAVDFITKAVKSVPTLANKVKMLKATAADLGQVSTAISPELVVLNSVVQYFPSQDYLFKVVQGLVQLEGIKTAFFGDIRSLALFQEFLAARALHIAGENASKSEFQRVMTDLRRAESELLVDPAFFTALATRLPQVEHVEIIPKKMYATNELSAFRYTAVVHVRGPGQQPQQIHEISQDEWIDFKEQRLSRQSLGELLGRNDTSSTVALCNIPHRKSIFERHVVRSLDDQEVKQKNDDSWILSARQEAQNDSSLSAAELAELASQAGYRVEISWARQYSQSGGLDAVFHHHQPAHDARRKMFRFPADHWGRPLHSLCNEPLRQQPRQKTEEQLHEMLRSRLPSYMVPQAVKILDKMPLNSNGKIDRRALAKNRQTRTVGRGPARQDTGEARPMPEIERQVREIWGGVLNMNPADIAQKDSFFHLGGNSILVMKVVSEARRAGLELTVANIFCHPELHDVVRLARSSSRV